MIDRFRNIPFIIALAALPLVACTGGSAAVPEDGPGEKAASGAAPASQSSPPENPAGLASAIFAGGCFWCMEQPFDTLDGVVSTTSGYTGGERPNPTYQQVAAGQTRHAEAVRVVYDPAKVTYEELLRVFWHNIDPTVQNRQFCDRGAQYRTAIYTQGDEQQRLAEASKRDIVDPKGFDAFYTEIVPAAAFYDAEDYHQDYYQKNPIRYRTYRTGCGRDNRLHELWGDAATPH